MGQENLIMVIIKKTSGKKVLERRARRKKA